MRGEYDQSKCLLLACCSTEGAVTQKPASSTEWSQSQKLFSYAAISRDCIQAGGKHFEHCNKTALK